MWMLGDKAWRSSSSQRFWIGLTGLRSGALWGRCPVETGKDLPQTAATSWI